MVNRYGHPVKTRNQDPSFKVFKTPFQKYLLVKTCVCKYADVDKKEEIYCF
jgi:hypothetical protein